MSSASSSGSSLCSSSISIKIHFGVDDRRMLFSAATPWNEVRSFILSCYLLPSNAGCNEYRFNYEDEEGDAIAIEQESEYIEAKRAAAAKGSLLKLNLIKVAQNGAPVPTSASVHDIGANLEENSDLEESYISVNDLSKSIRNQLKNELTVAQQNIYDAVVQYGGAEGISKDDLLNRLAPRFDSLQIESALNVLLVIGMIYNNENNPPKYSSIPFPASVVVNADASNDKQEKKADGDAESDASDIDEENKVDALSALIDNQKEPVQEHSDKASPPPPTAVAVAAAAVVEAPVVECSSSPAKKDEVIASASEINEDELFDVMSSLLSNPSLYNGLIHTVSSALVDYSISIASPNQVEQLRANRLSLIEKAEQNATKGGKSDLMARTILRRIVSGKKKPLKKCKSTKVKASPKTSRKGQPKTKPIAAADQTAATSPSTPSSSTSSGSSSSSSARAVHLGVRCDECNVGPIIGARFHCITCDEDDAVREGGGYDLCESCESSSKHCTNDGGANRHILVKMKTPAKIIVEKDTPSAEFLASGQPIIYDAFAHFGDESKAVPVGVVEGSSAAAAVDGKKEKKRGKKHAKKILKELLKQVANGSFSSSSSSSESENEEETNQKNRRKSVKKAEKFAKKAEKAAMRAGKWRAMAELIASKAINAKDDKKEEKIVEEKPAEIQEEKKEVKQEITQPIVATENKPVVEQVSSAAAAVSAPINKKEESSSSSSSSSIAAAAPSAPATLPEIKASQTIVEQKEANIPAVVPLPIAQPVKPFIPINLLPPPSLPSIMPAPLFTPLPFPSLPNPFVPPSSAPSTSPSAASSAAAPLFFEYPDELSQLTSMGFSSERSMEVLRFYNGDLRKALNRLL